MGLAIRAPYYPFRCILSQKFITDRFMIDFKTVYLQNIRVLANTEMGVVVSQISKPENLQY